MDELRRRAAAAAGVVVAGAGSLSRGFAATSMSAVRAAEARALGPGHTPELPGAGELQLVAPDTRLAAMTAVVCGLAIALGGLPRRLAVPAWLVGAAAVVVANATLGRAVEGGPVALAAAGLLLVTGASAVAAVVVARRRETTWSRPSGVVAPLLAGSLAAGTLPALAFQGLTSERYAAWVPADLATSSLVAALALAAGVVTSAVLLARSWAGAALGVALPVAALGVLLERQGSSWQVGDAPWAVGTAVVLAATPLVLAAAAQRSASLVLRGALLVGLLALGALLAQVPQLLAVPALLGGLLGMVFTSFAGASISYDGLPVVGGGLLVGAVVLAVCLALRGPDVPAPAPARAATPSRTR